MKTILEFLSDITENGFTSCGFDGVNARVTLSDRPDLCQYQCNAAFFVAKTYKTNPLSVAEKVVEFLSEKTDIFKEIQVIKPGFINITLTDRFLLDFLYNMYTDEKYGMPIISSPETLVIDYGGPNIAKPLHIGHLRSAIIGETLKRMCKFVGYNVISDVHIGDWGLPMGLIISEFEQRNPEWACFSDDFNENTDSIAEICVDELNKIYPYASQKSKEDEEFLKKAKSVTFDLQNRKKGYFALWKEIRKASVCDLKKIYTKLNVDFDLWNGESDSDLFVDELIEKLTEKGLLYESDGALVVNVAEETDVKPMPPVIIKKSDSSILYATTDLATIIERVKNYNPKKLWYVVDSRQSLHFEQVFRCAKKASLASGDTEFEFLGFGTMNGADGKPFKTRDGGVMQLETLLENAKEAAYNQISSSEFLSSTDESVKTEFANRISVAAIKFGDLSNHRTKNYIFDIDKFTSFEGKTGPYILYSITRINSIFNKLNINLQKAQTISDIRQDEERNLLITLLMSSDALYQAVKERAPNIICEHVYGLANAYSKFYQSCNIANEQDLSRKNDLINLTLITKEYLLLFLDLLGIEPVERM